VNDYDAQYDADTLMRAAEIKKDPNRVAKAKSYAAAKVKALSNLAGTQVAPDAEQHLMHGYRRLP
jgi:hypothetical protein